MISFIIYFHSTRLDNLRQTLRFLEKREPELLGGELVLICQDACSLVEHRFRDYRHLNLKEQSYRKPFMCNLGVREAKHEKIVILDSDRILPEEYFTANIQNMSKGQVITTTNLYWLPKPYTDKQIEKEDIEKIPDFRSINIESGKKNLFAGNTIMFKENYLASGGMDEAFTGYGYADNDMTRNMIRMGYDIVYHDLDELHLWHPRTVSWNGSQIDRRLFRIQSATNALRYNKKWGLPLDDTVRALVKEVRSERSIYSKELWEPFQAMISRKLM